MKKRSALTIVLAAVLAAQAPASAFAADCDAVSVNTVKINNLTSRNGQVIYRVSASSYSLISSIVLSVLKGSETVWSSEDTEISESESAELHMLQPGKSYTLTIQPRCADQSSGALVSKKFRAKKALSSSARNVTDVVSHVNVESSQGRVSDLLAAYPDFGISKGFLMPVPHGYPEDAAVPSDGANHYSFIQGNFGTLKVLYGGSELNPILHALSDNANLTTEGVFPNGIDGVNAQAIVDELISMRNDPSTWENEFRTRATEAANSGKYIGFGELSPLHYSYKQGQPFITFSADSDLLLWLAELAGEKGMFIVLHIEPTEESMTGLKKLLAANTKTTFVLDHVGWYETALSTPNLYRALLSKYKNLYLSLKIRTPRGEYSATRPLSKKGKLLKSWEKLFSDFPTRFLVSSDGKYWDDGYAPTTVLVYSIEEILLLLDQLPLAVGRRLARLNARRLE